MFDTFGPFTVTENVAEDWVMLVRARLLGDLLAIPDVLLKYRLGGGLTTDFSNYHRIMLRHARCVAGAMRQLARDAERVRDRLGEAGFAAFRGEAEARALREERMARLFASAAFRDRLAAFRELANRTLLAQPKTLGMMILCLFPPALSARLMQTAYRLMAAAKRSL